MKELRPYQIEAIEAVKQSMRKGNKRILLSLATGAGKSIIARSIAEMAALKNNSVLFTAHRTILIDQMRQTFEGLSNVTCGTLQAMHRKKHTVKLIIEDEAHYGNGSKMRDKMPVGVVTIGLSATPLNRDGSKLEGWDEIIDIVQLSDLIEMGYASPVRVLAPIVPELSSIKIKQGDYDISESFDTMTKSSMIRDIVGAYTKHAQGMRTLVFCVNIEHAEIMAQSFTDAGYRCDSVHSKKDSEDVMERFKRGDIDIVCNVDVLTTGVDIPDIYCIILATPTKSIVKAVQIYGRATRLNPADPHKAALIMDCSGVINDTIHPMQRMRFDKEKRINKKDLCRRVGCGGEMMVINRDAGIPDRDGFFLVKITKKCKKCCEINMSEKIELVPLQDCQSCFKPISNKMELLIEDNEAVFSLVCNHCQERNEYRKILLTDSELLEINPIELQGWDKVRSLLKGASGANGKKYHYLWVENVVNALQNIESDIVISVIERFKAEGKPLGGIINAISRLSLDRS